MTSTQKSDVHLQRLPARERTPSGEPHLRLTPPRAIVVAMSLGSVGNPSGFLALAVRPELPQRPATPFGALMVLSFAATTVGYGGAAWYVARGIVHAAY
jgi:hypothetical protein